MALLSELSRYILRLKPVGPGSKAWSSMDEALGCFLGQGGLMHPVLPEVGRLRDEEVVRRFETAKAVPTIAVSDLDRAKKFFGGTLGLKVIDERSDGNILALGELTA